MILRIQSSNGRLRVTVEDNSKVRSLYETVSNLINVPLDGFVLYYCNHRGNKTDVVIKNDSKTVGRDLGLTNGSSLWIEGLESYKDFQIQSTVTLSSPMVPMPIGSDSGEAPAKDEKEDVKDGKKKVIASPPNQKTKFVNFDAYLRDKEFNVSDLPLCCNYNSIKKEKGKMLKLPLSITLKHQPYRHVDHVELSNIDEIGNFVRHWASTLDMSTPKCGYLYGYYREDDYYDMGIRAVVEAIYEPPQTYWDTDITSILSQKDDFLSVVDSIASRLGLERIGFIFTHLPRDQIITSYEAMNIARRQLDEVKSNHYTGYPCSKFVVCTVCPNEEAGGDPIPNCFMISDLCMALLRSNLLTPPTDSSHLRIKDGAEDELLPQILEGGSQTTSIDVDWMIVRVNESAPKQIRTMFRESSFPKENRGTSVEPSAIRKYLVEMSKSQPSLPSYLRFSDFHLLLYIAKLFDAEAAFAICDCIAEKTEIDPNLVETLMFL